MIYTSQKQLEKALAKWQKILRLMDWKIDISIERGRYFSNQESQAEVEWYIQNKRAVIKILDPIDYEDALDEQDMELSLVHELLHLHLAPFDTFESGSQEEIALEQCIEMISMALVNLERKKCK